MKLNGELYTLKSGKEIRLPKIHVLEQNEKGEWVNSGDYLYVDGYLFENLYEAKLYTKKYNGDLLYVIDGGEGSGKSTLARQVGIILDSTYNHKRIGYSTKDFIKMYFEQGKFKSLTLDESKADLDRKRTMSKKNVEFMNFLSMSREPHHKLAGIVLPSIFDLDSYVAEHRASFLLHCYKRNGKTPGYFKFFGKNAIKKLFLYGKKSRSYNVNPSFAGRFANQQVVDLTEYNKIKHAVTQKYYEELQEDDFSERDIIKNYVLERIQDLEEVKGDYKIGVHAIAAVLGISTSTLYRYKDEIKEAKKASRKALS